LVKVCEFAKVVGATSSEGFQVVRVFAGMNADSTEDLFTGV